MNRSDLEAWRTARTLADLGKLAARWLEGSLQSQPGYDWPCDIEDTEMIPVLAELNRTGYLTAATQPHDVRVGGNGEHWEQLAAVEGFTDEETARRIVKCAAGAELTVIVHAPPPRWSRHVSYDRAVTVTWLNGQPFEPFGARIPQRDLRHPHFGYGICHRNAVNAVCNAWQVTVIDPKSCRPEYLWNTLARTLIGQAAA